jgi:DNA-binding HxlR family transcriptional regulator
MTKQFVECNTCRGSGKLPLPEHLRNTLTAIQSGCVTNPEIRKFLWLKYDEDLAAAAISNRLQELHRLGLVRRRKGNRAIGGTEYRYEARA